MLNSVVEKKLNDQINMEMFSAYLYLSMEAYFRSNNLDGFANWFSVQAKEEMDHAMKIFYYIDYVGGSIKLGSIGQPKADFSSPMEALEDALKHEQLVTKSIYDIVDAARQERDHKTESFLQWYVNEQVEEENNADTNIKKLKLAGVDGPGLYILDKELETRTYTPTPTQYGAEAVQ